MRLKSISFENYKAFSTNQTVKVKPITLLIGKNSSGKSSIAKLFTLLENSLSGNIREPLHFINKGVELGGEFIDLVYGKRPNTPIKFTIVYENGTIISVSILQEIGNLELTIFEWEIKGSGVSFALKSTQEKVYVDLEGNKYTCKFLGFIPIEIRNDKGENIAETFTVQTGIDVDYIGPFRVLPEREFYLTGQLEYSKTGVKGEHAYYLLGISKLMRTKLHEEVGKFYKEHFDGWELIVNDSNRPFVQINLSKNDTVVNIVDVGQGMNQALPLVVRASIAKTNSIVVIEQPELHLHPAAHGDVMELFIRSSKINNQTFVIETHSENMLLRLRKLVVENDFGLTHDDVVVYWIDDSGAIGQDLTEINIDKDGVLSEWPSGVFNENVSEILEIQKAAKRKTEK